MENWLDKEVDFYDFIWAYGVKACTSCINNELTQDFQEGGEKFQEMKNKILEQFPTRDSAMTAFLAEQKRSENE